MLYDAEMFSNEFTKAGLVFAQNMSERGYNEAREMYDKHILNNDGVSMKIKMYTVSRYQYTAAQRAHIERIARGLPY